MKSLLLSLLLLSFVSPASAMNFDFKGVTAAHLKFDEAAAINRTYEYSAPKVPSAVLDKSDSYGGSTKACENAMFAIVVNPVTFCKSATTAQLSFINVGDDGTTLSTEVLASNPLLKSMLASNRPDLRVRTVWELRSCDGVDVSSAESSSDLQTAIQQLRAYDFSQYMSCDFRAKTTAYSEDANALATYETVELGLKVLDNDDLLMAGSQESVYFSRKTAALPAAEDAATAAAAQFATIVKGYGALLVDLRDAPNSDRKASLLAYLAQNKPILLASLSAIDQQLPSCGTMTKLNVNFTIKRAYAFVRTLEASILGNYPFGDIVGHGY